MFTVKGGPDPMPLGAPHRHTAASDCSSMVGARAVNGHPRAVPGSSIPAGTSPAALCCPFPCGAWPSSVAMGLWRGCEAPRQFGSIAAGEGLEKKMGQSLSTSKVVRYGKREKDVGGL